MFNRAAPKISRGIGQVADVGRNIGQVIKHSRNIGSIANQISGGRLSQSPIAQKMQDVVGPPASAQRLSTVSRFQFVFEIF